MMQLVNSHFQAFVYKYEILATEHEVPRTKLYLICNSINLNNRRVKLLQSHVTEAFPHYHYDYELYMLSGTWGSVVDKALR
jgi:hypothetical protein